MAKLKEADFYYGAVLSTLLNNGVKLMLIEGGEDRQIYDLTTNDKEFRMFVKYRSKPTETKKEGYISWSFIFSPQELDEIKTNMHSEKDFSLGLVCGSEPLNKSQYAVVHKDDIEKWLQEEKTSLSISKQKGERYFRLSMSGGRKNALMIKAKDIY